MNRTADGAASADGELGRWRGAIDAIDAELVTLINRRAECALAIGAAKAAQGLPTFQQAREREVIERIGQLNHGPMRDMQLAPVWQAIMRASRELQSAARGASQVAYLGPAGTYSEQALLACFGTAARPQPYASIDAVFDAIEHREVEHAVVPIENSTEGPVTRSVDLLLDASVSIVNEVVIPVDHGLLSISGALDGIDCVMGHPQALAQCRGWLDAHCPALPRIEMASNAQAAQRAAASPDCAAVAGRAAAAQYGLKVIAGSIQDRRENRTRFVVLGHDTANTPAATGFDRTTLAVWLPDSAGALARLLAPFAQHRVSVLWMQARPLAGASWHYRFLLDLAGHRDDPGMAAALRDLDGVVDAYRVIGSYPRFDVPFTPPEEPGEGGNSRATTLEVRHAVEH